MIVEQRPVSRVHILPTMSNKMPRTEIVKEFTVYCRAPVVLFVSKEQNIFNGIYKYCANRCVGDSGLLVV